MAENEEQSLLATCEAVLLNPDGAPTLRTFLQDYSISTVTRVLQSVCSGPGRQSDASTITRGIKHLTATSTSNEALQKMLTPAQQALAATSPQLRVLGCDILSAWLHKQEPSADVTQPVLLLIHMLEDGETDVAAAAASALECLAVSPERLKLVLEPAPKQGLLASALGHENATVRSRALALTVNLAATSQEAADIVLASGALIPFMSELSSGKDLLARLAALEQLLEATEAATVPAVLRSSIVPHVLQLLEASVEPALQHAAIPAAARLLQDGENSELVRDVVAKFAAVVQAEDVPVSMEACIMDATCSLAQSKVCREAVAVSALMGHASERALGRGAPEDVSIPAMHAIAAVGGAEFLREESSNILSAPLSDSAEEALKQAVYDKALPSQHLEMGPAQRVLELLRAPFPDRKVPAYRMCTALSARAWFALEMCQHTDVLAHVCDAQSESGDLCMWRFGLLRVLEASAAAAAAGSALSQYGGKLREAALKGPYGVAGGSGEPMDVEPQVAVASRPS